MGNDEFNDSPLSLSISMVHGVLPELGKGFIEMCLEVRVHSEYTVNAQRMHRDCAVAAHCLCL